MGTVLLQVLSDGWLLRGFLKRPCRKGMAVELPEGMPLSAAIPSGQFVSTDLALRLHGLGRLLELGDQLFVLGGLLLFGVDHGLRSPGDELLIGELLLHDP